MMPATVTLSVQERWNASTLYHIDVRSQVGFKKVRGRTVAEFEALVARIKGADTPGMPEMPPLPPKKPPGDKKTRHEVAASQQPAGRLWAAHPLSSTAPCPSQRVDAELCLSAFHSSLLPVVSKNPL